VSVPEPSRCLAEVLGPSSFVIDGSILVTKPTRIFDCSTNIESQKSGPPWFWPHNCSSWARWFSANARIWRSDLLSINSTRPPKIRAQEVVRMRKPGKTRLATLSTLLLGALVAAAGCETKGPAEKAGESIDQGIQKAKDAVNPPGPLEKAGREVDKAIKP
jgi:hypothetical protein